MLAHFTWRRVTWRRGAVAGAVLVAALVTVTSPHSAHLVETATIRGAFKGLPVMLTATTRSAGAIESLQWGGMEFIDASDHGRHLQSAVSFDGLIECDNPTEAGASRDGHGPSTSSSRLLSASVAGNVLRTRSQMAYWLRPGQKSPSCGYVRSDLPAPLSSTSLAKTVRFLPGFGNVLEHRISFELARARSKAQFEALTAYMPEHFAAFYTYDFARDRFGPLSDGPGEQELPVVLATTDGTHALGLFTPQTARSDMTGPGYGRWRFNAERVTKSNVVFRVKNAAAGSHRFVVYSVFGTLDDVRNSLRRLMAETPDVAEHMRPPLRSGAAKSETLEREG